MHRPMRHKQNSAVPIVLWKDHLGSKAWINLKGSRLNDNADQAMNLEQAMDLESQRVIGISDQAALSQPMI